MIFNSGGRFPVTSRLLLLLSLLVLLLLAGLIAIALSPTQTPISIWLAFGGLILVFGGVVIQSYSLRHSRLSYVQVATATMGSPKSMISPLGLLALSGAAFVRPDDGPLSPLVSGSLLFVVGAAMLGVQVYMWWSRASHDSD